MYSNSKRAGPATFGDTAYCSVGDPYKDTVKGHKPDRIKGKQLVVTKNVVRENAKLTYSSEPYTDSAEPYLQSQPMDQRKRGFGSRDASKRSEFSSMIRCEQYRQALRAEDKFDLGKVLEATGPGKTIDDAIAKLEEEYKSHCGKTLADEGGSEFEVKKVKHLFDVGRSVNTEFDPKNSRDQFFHDPAGNKPRRYGHMGRPASLGVGASDSRNGGGSQTNLEHTMGKDNTRVSVTKEFFRQGGVMRHDAS